MAPWIFPAVLTIEQVAMLNRTLIEVVNKYEVSAMEVSNDHEEQSNESPA
jgi:hypothetical protein